MLNTPQLRKCPLGRQRGVAGVQTRAHDPVEDQRHETDRRVCANALRQAVIDGAGLDFRFEYAKAVVVNVVSKILVKQQ